MLFTAQEIVLTNTLNNSLAATFIAATGQYECLAEIVTVEAPQTEVLMKAKIQFARKKLFSLIQTLQQKDLKTRRETYDQIKRDDQ